MPSANERLRSIPLWVNVGLNQLAWFACVLGAARGYSTLGTAIGLATIALHVRLSPNARYDLSLIAVAATVGFVVDASHVALGVTAYANHAALVWACPLWIVVLWMSFATTLRHSLHRLLGHHVMAAVLGAFVGPLAFATGQRMGALQIADRVEVGPLLVPGFVVIGASWAAALPILVWFADPQAGTH